MKKGIVLVDSFNTYYTYIYRFYLLPCTNNSKGWSLSDFLVLKYLTMAPSTPRSDGAVGVTCGVKASCECCNGSGTLGMVPLLFNHPRSPLKGYIPNKYPLHKVYMGLIIKGTIPRVPPFSLWNLCSDWVVPSTALTASWYTLENCREVSRELGRKYWSWSRPSVMPKNV